MNQLTTVPLSGPIIYPITATCYNGFMYTIGVNLPDFSTYAINGVPQLLKYKCTSTGLVFVGSINFYINLADVASFSTQSVEFYNDRFYYNSTRGIDNFVYVVEAKDLETKKSIFPCRLTLPQPANINHLTISPTGVVYVASCPAYGTGNNTVANYSLQIATVLTNGAFSPFVKSTAPSSYLANADGTGYSVFYNMPTSIGLLSQSQRAGDAQWSAIATTIDPQTGKWSQYSAPGLQAFVKSVSGTNIPSTYSGPGGRLVGVYYGSQGLPTLFQVVNNDIKLTTFSYGGVTFPTAIFPTSAGCTDTMVYWFNTADDDSTVYSQSYGTISTP
jgi:hypothetical protein